jgi:mycoredoxin-dependent peroxiredoxin
VLPVIGQSAPDFTTRTQHGQSVRLSDLRGVRVALVFYPWAFSNVCLGELRDLRDRARDFEAAAIDVLAISCDPVYALRAWADQERFSFDLLTDHWPHGEIARAYGVFDTERGVARRGSFAIDSDGRLLWSVVHDLDEARAVDDLLRAFA